MMGVKFQYTLYLALLIIGLNFFYELFVPILNTKDVVDAYFGTAAVGLAVFFLFLIDQRGMREKL